MAKTVFERKFCQNLRRLDKRLKAYLEDTEKKENIHDVSVSIRKHDIMSSLLSKKVRKRCRPSIKKYREFLRANNSARDCDIITGRLAALGAHVTGDLQKKKRAELLRAVRLARSLKKIQPMQFGAPDSKRTDKIADRLVTRVLETLPVVLSDASRVEELHRIRRNLRKLRYITDVMPHSTKKKYMTKLRRAIGKGESLEELQDLLGSIHDCDITIDYLRTKNDDRILGKEIRNRGLLYEKFISYLK